MKDHAAGQGGFLPSKPSFFDGILWALTNFIRRNRGMFLFVNSLRSIKKHGIKKAAGEFVTGIRGQEASLETYVFMTKFEKTFQTIMVFPKKFKISIIADLYNTPEQSLREMIESVMEQTYGNWELCLADGSDKTHANVKHICKNYAEKDNRITYRKFNRSLGISGRLNKAIEMTSGGYIGVLDQGDVLHPSALFEVMRIICTEGADFIYTDEAVFANDHYITLVRHKPCYAVDTLCSYNYIGHFIVFDKKLAEKAGVFRSEFDGSQDYDLVFRYTDAASKVYHISKLLYFSRNGFKYTAPDITRRMEAISAAEKAISSYLTKHGKSARVERKIGLQGFYRVIYELTEKPVVSIIIPNKNNAVLLRDCISSILEKSTYEEYEIIIVENNSSEDAVFAFYEELKMYPNIHVVHWKGRGFNYSEICNFGVQYSHGRQLVFLNNDVQIISPDWIEEMLMYSQRGDVGAVGAKLYYLNGSIQHAGVVLGMGGIAGHVFHGAPHNSVGYMGKLQIVQNMSVVTAACMMIRRDVFDEVGHFAPEFPTSFNDVDLCLKIRKAGYLIVWTPYAEAYHLESRSRGYNITNAKKHKLVQETASFKLRWEKELAAGDPYYNRNFSLDKTDYRLV